jgi:hypothetical protein
MTTITTTTPSDRARRWLLSDLNGIHFRLALTIYLLLVASHFAEHAAQILQVYVLDVPRPRAGGLLGLLLPGLVMAEVLHTTWNSLQLTGLILLAPGTMARGRLARALWLVAIALQTWHWFEHAVIQLQYVTGIYLYGAAKQMSILERLLPRIELHFAYNLMVFIPTVAAVAALVLANRRARRIGSRS